jgi:hypothetical protein
VRRAVDVAQLLDGGVDRRVRVLWIAVHDTDLGDRTHHGHASRDELRPPPAQQGDRSNGERANPEKDKFAPARTGHPRLSF